MKKIKALPLFYILLFNCYQLVAQQKIDSLSFYTELVNFPKEDTDLSRSYQFFDTHSKNSLKDGDTIQTIYGLRYRASIEYKSGFYFDSEETTINALTLSDQVKTTPYVKKLRKSIFNHLGIIYREQGNITAAIDLYNKALQLSENQKDSAIIFNNIANIYKDNHAFKKAKESLLKAYQLIKKTNDTLSTALILDNLGLIKLKMNSTGAFSDLTSALKLREQKNDISTIYTSYNHLALFYKEKKQYVKSREYAIKANDIALKLNRPSYRQDALGLLLELGEDAYARQYKLINDSINYAKQKSNNKFALVKYDLTKQEELTKESEAKAEKEKLKRLMYQRIVALLFLSLILLILFLKSRHKKNVFENTIKTEAQISKKIHDVVANDLYQAMTKLQSDTNSKEDILDDLENVYDKARDISKENNSIDVNEDFSELLKDLLLSYKSKSIHIITKNISAVNWNKASYVKKTTVYRVLQELMTNMKKHSKASIVVLTFYQKSKLIINYSDNGIGSIINKQGGLHNAENRIKSIKGKIIFESDTGKGFKAIITI